MNGRTDAFCVGLILVGLSAYISLPNAAPIPPSTDFAIIGPHDEVICAKSKETCLTALKAIQNGWWTPFNSRNTSLLRCEPKSDCFPLESNCIKGYNCK